jgi:hypothetical protein
MRIVNQPPPIFDEIVAAFPHAALPGVMFCWREIIYIPQQTGPIPAQLIAHEQAHCDRQAGFHITDWWRRYISDQQFRLDEEMPAHVVELREWIKIETPKWVGKRALKRHLTGRVARRLADKLYGPMITYENARTILEAEIG